MLLHRNLKIQEQQARQRRRTEFHKQRTLMKSKNNVAKTTEAHTLAPDELRDWGGKVPAGNASRNSSDVAGGKRSLTAVVPVGSIGSSSPLQRKLPPKGTSLLVLQQKNPLRLAIFRFVEWKRFDHFILFLIGLSSVLLALDEPYLNYCDSECSTLKALLFWSDR